VLLCTKLQRTIPQATLLFYYPGIPVSRTKILESPTCSTFGRQMKKEWINRMKKRKNMTCETDSERSMCVRYHNLVCKLTLHLLHAKTTDICVSLCWLNSHTGCVQIEYKSCRRKAMHLETASTWHIKFGSVGTVFTNCRNDK